MELKTSELEADTGPVARRPRWGLTQSAFQGLLSSLDADEGRAAQRYERLRQRLIIFFAGRRCPEAEDHADETLDRVSRRIDEGEPIRDVTRFAYGVARMVLSEWFKRLRRRQRLLTRLATSSAPARWDPAARTVERDGAVACIRRCANRLPPEDRNLILHYYVSAGRDQQEERKALAARLGLSPVAVRLRAHRIRRVLESCTRECLADQHHGGPER